MRIVIRKVTIIGLLVTILFLVAACSKINSVLPTENVKTTQTGARSNLKSKMQELAPKLMSDFKEKVQVAEKMQTNDNLVSASIAGNMLSVFEYSDSNCTTL